MNNFTDIPDVPENIKKFVEAISKKIGNFEADLFESHCDEYFTCYLDNSPVEQLLFTALSAVAHVWNTFFQDKIEIEPQKEIGKYRVDFVISHFKVGENDKTTINNIVVECDSQQFHERTEEERRYEKKRDRYLLQQGLNIFHYTGKEIIESPFKVAHDIIKNLTGSEWEKYEIIKIDADSLRGDSV